MNPETTSARNCRKVEAIAMTGGFTTADRNDQGRLAASGHACIDLPAGSVDFHHAAAVECSAERNHCEAGVGRQLGDQVEVTPAQQHQQRLTAASRKANAANA